MRPPFPYLRHRMTTYLGLLCATGFTATTWATPMPMIEFQTVAPATLDEVDIRLRNQEGLDAGDSTHVYADGELLLQLRHQQFLRFRFAPGDERWIGTERRPMNLCWSYNDVLDYVIDQVQTVRNEDGFSLIVSARQPSVDSRMLHRIDARWDAARKEFVYALDLSLDASLEQWYTVSRNASRAYAQDPEARANMTAFNYHIDRISTATRHANNQSDLRNLYDYMVQSPDGAEWTRMPKLPIAFTTPFGADHSIANMRIEAPGEYFGVIDREKGGWIKQVVHSPTPVILGFCWMYYDIHNMMRDVVPPRHSTDRLELQYVLHFRPIDVEEGLSILADAVEPPWRDSPEYQVPIFTRHNVFDRLTDGSRDFDWVWWKSSLDCEWDPDTAYQTGGSVRITRATADPTAWYSWCWGYQYDEERLRGSYRVRARIKTENLDGKAHIALGQFRGGQWLYREEKRGEWVYSDPVSGTTDGWVEVSIIADISDARRMIKLEQIGAGTAWFDEVIIEKIE